VRLLGIAAVLLLAGTGALDRSEPPGHSPDIFDPLLLNIRLSATRLQPPAGLIQETWMLDGYRLGRVRPHAPSSAIIEDDQHRRLLILSALEDGTVKIYRLGEVPVNLTARVPAIIQCAREKRCGQARLDPAGEMGCVALCLLESLKQ
jgi:hypothetical protein